MERAKLRFKVGDRVLARCGGGIWKEAIMTQVWSWEGRPYKMRTVQDNEDIYTHT